MKKHKLIILDADGTLRYCTIPGQPCPNNSEEWELYPGVKEILNRYDWGNPKEGKIGYGIASNQGGVGCGYFSEETAKQLLQDTFEEAFGFKAEVNTIEMCVHVPYSGCTCRKPGIGMITNLMERYQVTPAEVLFVGDRDADKGAAENAGCDFVWACEFFEREPD